MALVSPLLYEKLLEMRKLFCTFCLPVTPTKLPVAISTFENKYQPVLNPSTAEPGYVLPLQTV